MFFIVGPIPLPCELNFLAGLRVAVGKSGTAGVRIPLDFTRGDGWCCYTGVCSGSTKSPAFREQLPAGEPDTSLHTLTGGLWQPWAVPWGHSSSPSGASTTAKGMEIPWDQSQFTFSPPLLGTSTSAQPTREQFLS